MMERSKFPAGIFLKTTLAFVPQAYGLI